ncbi:hypothetical protein BofuT4_uP084250.1 [Botrytis cinerea T4]|uniref:Uncharacterized protein n=1 Tax=Botryotinia fuckeliana (strain T4) TaxID=999810 RepID=G2YJI4_BOTF4|nr:hypothetical protein BofuT4_uP084250.1 [Botrytis cinerea T4]
MHERVDIQHLYNFPSPKASDSIKGPDITLTIGTRASDHFVMSHNDIERNKRVANIWTARFMPFALTGVVGYVTKFSLGETEK